MNMVISQEDYDKHNEEREAIKNIRLRDENQDFFDALASVNLETSQRLSLLLNH